MSQRNLPPTPKKLRDAREKGDVVKAADPAAAALLATCTAYLYMATGPALAALVDLIDWVSVQAYGDFRRVWPTFLSLAGHYLLVVMTPLLLLVIVANVCAHLLVHGPVFSPESASFKPEKLNPIEALKGWFKLDNFIEGIKSVVKITALTVTAFLLMRADVANLIHAVPGGIGMITAILASLLLKLLVVSMIVFFVVALLDTLVQRLLLRRRNLMTFDEVRREYIQEEGQPEVKQHRKAMHRELLEGSGRARRPSVVVTNPTHLAVSLFYDATEAPVPLVLDKGAGLRAQAIISEARRQNIPVVRHIPLARALMWQVDVEDTVPPRLFGLVVEVLKAVKDMAPRPTPPATPASPEGG